MTKHTFLTLTSRTTPTTRKRGSHRTMRRPSTNTRPYSAAARPFAGQKRTDDAVAEILGCHSNTVGKIRRRFLKEGLEAVLTDKPMGPTAPRKMTGELEARLTLLACSEPPEGRSQLDIAPVGGHKRSNSVIVESLSHVTVGETLKKTKSNPGGCRPGVSASRPRST